jgi:hypothetical protein
MNNPTIYRIMDEEVNINHKNTVMLKFPLGNSSIGSMPISKKNMAKTLMGIGEQARYPSNPPIRKNLCGPSSSTQPGFKMVHIV